MSSSVRYSTSTRPARRSACGEGVVLVLGTAHPRDARRRGAGRCCGGSAASAPGRDGAASPCAACPTSLSAPCQDRSLADAVVVRHARSLVRGEAGACAADGSTRRGRALQTCRLGGGVHCGRADSTGTDVGSGGLHDGDDRQRREHQADQRPDVVQQGRASASAAAPAPTRTARPETASSAEPRTQEDVDVVVEPRHQAYRQQLGQVTPLGRRRCTRNDATRRLEERLRLGGLEPAYSCSLSPAPRRPRQARSGTARRRRPGRSAARDGL